MHTSTLHSPFPLYPITQFAPTKHSAVSVYCGMFLNWRTWSKLNNIGRKGQLHSHRPRPGNLTLFPRGARWPCWSPHPQYHFPMMFNHMTIKIWFCVLGEGAIKSPVWWTGAAIWSWQKNWVDQGSFSPEVQQGSPLYNVWVGTAHHPWSWGVDGIWSGTQLLH